MPVRCKGLSEYKRNFKWKESDQSRLCSPAHEQKCRWAGLRSDELGMSREPNFISKRRVPYYNTQISKSFEWNGNNHWENDASSEFEIHEPLDLHSNDKGELNQKKIKTPDAPKLSEEVHSSSTGSRSKSTAAFAQNKKSPPETPLRESRILASTKKGKIDNGLKKVLQKKAGMNLSQSSNFPRSSEYQRQFVWKTSEKVSPVLAADQFIHSASKSIPPFKSPAIIPETEYERSFKASPSVKEVKQKSCLEEKEHPVSEPTETSPGEKRDKKETFSKTTEDLSDQVKLKTEDKQQKQKHKSLCLHRSFRKMNTEYTSNFLSPAQYIYKDGAWLRIRRNIPDQVKELREKAKAYRQRIRGTHFSRDHLNQILSDNNRLWDLSSDSSAETLSNNIRALDLAGIPEKQNSPGPKILPQPTFSEQLAQNTTEKLGITDAPTVPVRRRLVWGEPANSEQLETQPPELEKGEEKENKQKLEESKKVKDSDKDASTDNRQEENVSSPADTTDSSSVFSRRGGRLPTPRLRALGGAQRTHHDLTTPATGGAILVSPVKVKSLSSLQARKGSSEKHALPNNKVSEEDLKRRPNRDEGEAISLSPSPTAGLKTLDPFPLRKDEPSLDASGVRTPLSSVQSEKMAIVPVLESAKDPSLSYWSPSRRIQGTLRDPEFQHNGNVSSSKRSWLQLPLQERNCGDEDDDRLSQLSARSAASSSLASQVLERAQRRKENFWGKV